MTEYFKALSSPVLIEELHSACTNPPLSVTYRPGEWVEATAVGTPLFVFTEKMSAVHFARAVVGSPQVWRCECRDVAEVPVMANTHPEQLELSDLWVLDGQWLPRFDGETLTVEEATTRYFLSRGVNFTWVAGWDSSRGARAVKLLEPVHDWGFRTTAPGATGAATLKAGAE